MHAPRTPRSPVTSEPICQFQIFVTGNTKASRRSVENLRLLCEAAVTGTYGLEVVDVSQDPRLAEESRVIATPTVIRRSSGPPRRFIGGLSNPALASIALDLAPPRRHWALPPVLPIRRFNRRPAPC